MIWPLPCCFMRCAAYLVSRNGPYRLVRITRSQSSIDSSSIEQVLSVPALLISTSMRPKVSITALIASYALSGSPTSHCVACTRAIPPSPSLSRSDSATACARSRLRSPTIMFAPDADKTLQSAAPSPLAPPLMKIDFPESMALAAGMPASAAPSAAICASILFCAGFPMLNSFSLLIPYVGDCWRLPQPVGHEWPAAGSSTIRRMSAFLSCFVFSFVVVLSCFCLCLFCGAWDCDHAVLERDRHFDRAGAGDGRRGRHRRLLRRAKPGARFFRRPVSADRKPGHRRRCHRGGRQERLRRGSHAAPCAHPRRRRQRALHSQWHHHHGHQ